MKTYNINLLDEKSLKGFEEELDRIKKLFNSYEFKEFILNKSQQELEKICTENLHNLESYGEQANYMSGMYTEIDGDSIILGNESIVNIDGKNMKPETKARYSSELSLAKIVEFGVGALGTSDEDWETNINQSEHIKKYGRDGWYYVDDSGNVHWTTGIEGKFIFYKLSEKIKENVADWINEYLNQELD